MRAPGGLEVYLTNCSFTGESFCAPLPDFDCTDLADSRTLHCVGKGKSTFEVAPFFYRDGLGHCHRSPTLLVKPQDTTRVPETPEVPCPVPYPANDPPDPPHW